MEIKFKLAENPILEEFQQHEVQFAYVKPWGNKYIAQHPLVICRDFLTDIIWAQKHRAKFQIYGFKWSYKKNWNPEFLYISFPTEQAAELFKTNLQELQALEIRNFIEKTIIVWEQERSFILKFSRQWTRQLWAFSFYTFLLKLISMTTLNNPDINVLMGKQEYKHIKIGSKAFYFLTEEDKLRKGLNTFDWFPSLWRDIHFVHNKGGFVANNAYFTL
jgi:hypothetical protein